MEEGRSEDVWRWPPGAGSQDGSPARRAAEAIPVPFARPPRRLLPKPLLPPSAGRPLHRCSRGRRLFPRRNRNINSQLAIPANHVKAFKQKGFLLIRAGWAPIGKRVI